VTTVPGGRGKSAGNAGGRTTGFAFAQAGNFGAGPTDWGGGAEFPPHPTTTSARTAKSAAENRPD
jgi:hypothetical protein